MPLYEASSTRTDPQPTQDGSSAPGLHAHHHDELAEAPLVQRHRPFQWLSAAVLALLVAMAVHTLVTNHRFQWNVVSRYFFSHSIINGLILTLWLTAAVMVTGYLLGIGLAVMRLSSNPVLKFVSSTYVWLIRSVPPLVQLLFWYELASLYPRVSLGIPFGAAFVTVRTAHLFTGIVAAFVGLTLDVGAFSAEIVRGGLLSVERGQTEAAQALGLSPARMFRRIVLPQAMPSIVPATGNMLIAMLKATSIVSVIAVSDLLYSAELIYNQNFLVIPLLLVATIWYIILTTALSIVQFYIERHYGRGNGRASSAYLTRARRNLAIFQKVRADLPVLP